jgi:hypothetical protein
MLLEEIISIRRGETMISFGHKGDFSKTERFLNAAQRLQIQRILQNYGWQGVRALSMATPTDTGLTASCWSYEIRVTPKGCRLAWYNSNFENGAPVAILIQYGHGTKNGAYVQGIDYINPVMQPLFNTIADALWEEVSRL